MEFGQLHHIEYYVNDLARSNQFWGWFLVQLGYKKMSEWHGGISWAHPGGTYLVFCQVKEDFIGARNTRQGNGLNHIAFMGGSALNLDLLQGELESRGIKILERQADYLCFEDPNEFAVEVYGK